MLQQLQLKPHWQSGGIAPALAIVVLSLAVAALPLVWAAALVAGLVLTLAIMARPHWALYLLALSIPLESLRSFNVGGASVGTTELLVGLLALSWLLRIAVFSERPAVPQSITLPLLLLLTVVIASGFRATAVGPVVKEAVRWLELLVVLAAGTQLLTPRRGAILLALLFAAALAESLLGFAQFFLRLGPNAFRTGGFLRAYGTFGQPNPFAGYLGTLLPLALALTLAVWRHAGLRRSWPGIVTTATFLTLTAALLTTMSRGGWLGFAFGAVVVASLFNRRTFLLTVFAGFIGVFVVLLGAMNVLPAQISERLTQIVSYFGVFDVRTVAVGAANWAVVERMAIWQAAWGMFEAFPLLGVGAGNYTVAYPLYMMPGWINSMGHAHNLYLNLLAETGLAGLGAFLLFWLAGMRQLWLLWRRADSGQLAWWQWALPLGVLGVMGQLSLHNMFDNLMVHGLNVQLAMLLALALNSRRGAPPVTDR